MYGICRNQESLQIQLYFLIALLEEPGTNNVSLLCSCYPYDNIPLNLCRQTQIDTTLMTLKVSLHHPLLYDLLKLILLQHKPFYFIEPLFTGVQSH